jgi:hypothetical protein
MTPAAGRKFMREIGLPALKKRVAAAEMKVREERILREAAEICTVAFEQAASIADRIEKEQDTNHGAANTGGAGQVAQELRNYSMKNFSHGRKR